MNEIALRKLQSLYKHIESESLIDDITFSDLNLNEVFEMINETESSIGEEILYAHLRRPYLDENKLSEFEKKISSYENDEKLFTETKKSFRKLSKLSKYSVFEYLFAIADIEKVNKFTLFIPMILIAVALLIMPFSAVFGILFLTGAFFYNVIAYFKKIDSVKPYLICLSYIFKTADVLGTVPGIDSKKVRDLKKLKTGSFWLGSLNGVTVNGGNGNPLDIFIDILKLGLHIDLIVFYSIVDKITEHTDEIFEFLMEAGELDVACGIASFRKKNDKLYCIPVHDRDSELKIVDFTHPLVENCVPNSVSANKNILLTGSNASGKSTFLRAVAINIILSQAIHTVFASSYEAPIFTVISSMSLKDDVLSGESFYMAEIKAIKRIIDLCSQNNDRPVCAFTDEVLRGTNTKERIAASSGILSYIGKRALSFTATHDIELTKILRSEYDNFHFSEDIVDQNIHFSYILKPGSADTSNAIRLLEENGFPEEITKKALSSV